MATFAGTGAVTFGGTISATGGNSGQWNTAYTVANAALPKAGGTMTGGLSGTTADFSGKVEFQGTAAIEGGTSGSGYGLFKGYSANYNHFLLSRGSVTGSTSSPTFGGTHQI